jgi:hypothetical protein
MKNLAAILTIALAPLTAAYGGVITTIGQDAGVQLDVIGITGFSTFGSDMGGLSVVATFGVSGPMSCIWAPTSATAGGCDVPGFFTITQDGDTFSDTAPWTLTNTTTFDNILSLTLDGTPARLSDSGVVFDRTFGGAVGTPGSALGKDANGSTSDASNGSAVYSNFVAVSPSAPVEDIFTTLTIRFGNGLSSGANAQFVADTDTVGVFVPEPGTIALFGLGLAGCAVVRRRFARR